MSSKQKYSFPSLKVKQILECLRELQIPCAKEDITEPTPDRIREIYEQFVYILMGITPEEIRQPDLQAIDVLQFPELHEESLPRMSLNRNILRLFHAVGVFDASMSDFFAPKAGRTRKILSALINFAKFREERVQTYEDLTAQSDQLVDMKQQLEHQNAHLQSLLTELEQQREQELPQIRALEEENEGLATSIQEANKEHAQRREAVRTIKTNLTELQDNIANNKFNLLNIKQENDTLKSQIVRSPEKLKKSLVTMGVNVETTRSEISQLTQKLRELQTRADTLTKAEDKLVKRIKNMDEVEGEIKKCKDLYKQIKDTAAACSKSEENARQLAAHELHLKKQINTGQDKLFRLQRQFEQKRHAAQMAMDQVQSHKMEILRSNAKDKVQLEQNQGMIAKKQQEIAKTRESHNNEMQLLRQQYHQLGESVQAYHQQLLQAMANPKSLRV